MPGASKKRLLLAVGGIAILAVVAVVIVLATRSKNAAKPAEPAGDQVKLEIRAKPLATITMGGRSLGRTPLSIVVKRGTTPLEIEATFTVDRYRLKDKQKITRTLKETRIVVPSENQSVDFAVEDAKTLPGEPATE